ncbi:MFS transporter [Candidatus Cerribacteria bacterium 'Amazon FNV 2010 28 9']|uniref:MFS transporter n=1 Tax=Candidatus Cerribacteria bacterium 'Amazon FNV 2010 28 9' TaxID=2081795 RepID=A0A317JQR9_9BACT|nr:MAG: MFS transporter [Candidatus Cerribacteria bacterium 'Amazon FNV 2010 28 9']
MSKKQHSNQTILWIISFIAIVNALGYGIIIPLQFSYVARFGINTFWVGVLFAAYSLAQFISTPIIGRLSDRFGRKPMLAYSVAGTAISFLLMALAHNALMVFIARILDGISGGNISVAQAVISDTTDHKERAKWFGILGASFGMGFVFGPAIGGALSAISLQAPFYFAAFISVIATILVIFVLQETQRKDAREKKPVAKLFDLRHLVTALFEPYVGLVLIASFIASFAFSIFILGFQAFTNDVLKLSPTNISLLFMMFGVIGLVMQGAGLGKMVKKFHEVPLLIMGTVVTLLSFIGMGASNTFTMFIIFSIVLAIGNSFLAPIITALLSKHTKKEDQGGIMGINQSYVSLAQIVGPIIGGVLATISVHYSFYGAAGVLVFMLLLTLIIARESGKHVINL